MLKRYLYIFIVAMFTAVFGGCSDEIVQPVIEENGEIAAGERIMFTSFVPQNSMTRSAKEDFQTQIKESYKAVNRKYAFTVKMYKKNPTDATSSLVETAYYRPKLTPDGTAYVEDGTLLEAANTEGMYWPDNVNHYGFEITAGNEGVLRLDQSKEEMFLEEDFLKGYSYEPVWDGNEETGNAKDDINAINYRTSNGWYNANKQVYADFHQMPIGSDEYKKVPLFIQHQRALVTVILKAGEGVGREQLKHATSEENIHTKIICYSGAAKKEITPLPEDTYINYKAEDYGGARDNVENMTYHAIVDPCNYLAKAEEQPICTINLSNQKFSFYAANDNNYNAYTSDMATHGVAMSDAAKFVEEAYNLKPGKHLIITATLTRESRKILITAYVEDWTDKVTTTICDDYGKNGDPILIRTREELIAFLKDPKKNKAGNVAIISPTTLDLENTVTTNDKGQITSSTPAPWPIETENFKLNCMLNLAGAVLYTEHTLFKEMSPSANLINGSIVVRSGNTLSAVVTDRNEGTIEQISVSTVRTDAAGKPLSKDLISKVTSGGLVKDNYGTILQCSSSIPVYGTTGYVGGIAAQSLPLGEKTPVISECSVSARVDGTAGVIAGGGIVGNATGLVSENTFEYGITVLQGSQFLNIIGARTGEESSLTATHNAWPTTLANGLAGSNNNPNAMYTGIIDSQAELRVVVTDSEKNYNTADNKILIADDFIVGSDWNVGRQDATLSGTSNGNVFFELFGNDKTITLAKSARVTVGDTAYDTAPMLFTNIQNKIHDLTLVLEESLIAQPSSTTSTDGIVSYDGLDAIAPLGYSAWGPNAILSNIKVKTAEVKTEDGETERKYIQAAMPGGLVAWAYGGAKFENCQFNGKINVWLPSGVGSDALRYAGGIAAMAERATFTGCLFHLSSADSFTVINEAQHSVYCGGILGGVGFRDNTSRNAPSVILKECGSNLLSTSEKKGALIGRSSYDTRSTGGNQSASGVNSDQCEGNWWEANYKAIGTTYNGMTDVNTVGQRNSVKPTFNSF